jgi:hypothetical protein
MVVQIWRMPLEKFFDKILQVSAFGEFVPSRIGSGIGMFMQQKKESIQSQASGLILLNPCKHIILIFDIVCFFDDFQRLEGIDHDSELQGFFFSDTGFRRSWMRPVWNPARM